MGNVIGLFFHGDKCIDFVYFFMVRDFRKVYFFNLNLAYTLCVMSHMWSFKTELSLCVRDRLSLSPILFKIMDCSFVNVPSEIHANIIAIMEIGMKVWLSY